ncbi:hypothetical protein [Bifidobacterium breve]|uniref:hypothetical protein n=1 Tax=Bifidobacterium breve TaxID=1685 RepID=UPI001178C68E|nr:hypothetical protein [Bifidobacterium breve]
MSEEETMKDFTQIRPELRRCDAVARYFGLSIDTIQRWNDPSVLSARIVNRIAQLITVIATESGTSVDFIRWNAALGQFHHLYRKNARPEHIAELSTLTLIQKQMNSDNIPPHVPAMLDMTMFAAAWLPYEYWTEAKALTATDACMTQWVARTSAARNWQVSEVTLRAQARGEHLTAIRIGGTVLHRISELNLRFSLRHSN